MTNVVLVRNSQNTYQAALQAERDNQRLRLERDALFGIGVVAMATPVFKPDALTI